MRDVFIVDGYRTPYLKSTVTTGPFGASDLAVQAGRHLLNQQDIPASEVDGVVLGCVMPSENEANIARIVALRLGCGNKVSAYTVQRNCASGMQSIDSAAKDIMLGRSELMLAGGTEAMSQSPLMWSAPFRNWFASLMSQRSMLKKVQQLAAFPIKHLRPVVALEAGLSDPIVGLNMGQTAENIASLFQISREQMDEFAFASHQKAMQAEAEGHCSGRISMVDKNGMVYDRDTGVRADSSLAKLAKLKPYFDRHYGSVTPGNSSQVTDGAAMLLLASEEAVKRHKLNVLGRLVDTEWAALAPELMGLGPVMSTTPLLQRQKLVLNDIDFWEINEAFAAQVLGCLAAWQDKSYCQTHLGLDKPFGELDQEKLNVDGGAIALGHPVGSSGARIVLQVLNIMQRHDAKRGVATICIGGGQGGAMLLARD